MKVFSIINMRACFFLQIFFFYPTFPFLPPFLSFVLFDATVFASYFLPLLVLLFLLLSDFFLFSLLLPSFSHSFPFLVSCFLPLLIAFFFFTVLIFLSGPQHAMTSLFFNEMYAFDMERKRSIISSYFYYVI